ncbi:MAG: hypothetical protein LBP72_06465, partial [Dysgonamonadaceae bacterium]|nr:hypothetical protein [Dysgonamonadaceae bacterium]
GLFTGYAYRRYWGKRLRLPPDKSGGYSQATPTGVPQCDNLPNTNRLQPLVIKIRDHPLNPCYPRSIVPRFA